MSEFDQLECTEVEVESTQALQVPGSCSADPSAIGEAIREAFETLCELLGRHALVPSGPPRCIYTSHSVEGIQFVVAMPLAEGPNELIEGGAASVGRLPCGKTLRFTHRGPYPNLMATYGQITQYMLTEGLMQSEADWAKYMPMWEEYCNDPNTTPENELLTYIYLPIS